MAPLEAPPPPAADLGRMASNGMVILSLQTALSRSDSNLTVIPKLICRVVEEKAFEAFVLDGRDDRPFRWNAAEFRTFIKADRPAGLQSSEELIRRIVDGTDAAVPFHNMTRGTPGNPDWQGQPRQDDCTFSKDGPDRIRNHVTDSEPTPAATQRDYARESKQGNSVSYALRRLGKQRPDLLDEVKAGKLSPNRAMVEAGFRLKSITVEADPAKAGRRLARHFTREQFSELVNAALDVYQPPGD